MDQVPQARCCLWSLNIRGYLLYCRFPLFIYLLAPQYQTQRVAIRVPFFTRLVEDLQLNVNNGSSDIKPGRWQRFSLVFGWILLVISAAKPVWLGDEETRDLDGRDLMVLVDLSVLCRHRFL
ncbi:hypothetical protein [Vibrio gallaecicus]|uniref:hypothetical protein n=1 Tax=Vibrio gallaecicus TaxID=552386 RepID=UPI0025B5F691|nr:hypothetical protein [Vibrio gallaecicus]MDN3617754.1 hypothetical protein [Vibrio gallaecicus]